MSQPIVLQPPDRTVVPDEFLRIVMVARSAINAPDVTLDGRTVALTRYHLGWDAAGTSRHVEKPSASSNGARSDEGGANGHRLAVGTSVLVASAELEPGAHQVATEGVLAQVFVQPSENDLAPPEGWSVFQLHPPGPDAQCKECHEITETAGGQQLGRALMPDACFKCHPSKDFELTHAHRIEALSACHTCHQPHGGARPALLTEDPRILCAVCHD